MCLLNYLKIYIRTIFLLCSVDISISSLPNDFSSLKSETCRFKIKDEDVIDLSPLANSSQPMIQSTTSSIFIYHPCRDIPLNAKVNNSCQQGYGLCCFIADKIADKPLDFNQVLSNQINGTFMLLANNAEAVFRLNEMNQPEIVYKHSNLNKVITSYIKLVCDKNVDSYKLTTDKSLGAEYVLTLTSRHACPEAKHYMSGGAVFFIILLVFFCLYFIGGILVLKFIRGATGLEMIPNHDFWCKIPQLTKDGIAYLVSCGKSTPDSYEKI